MGHVAALLAGVGLLATGASAQKPSTIQQSYDAATALDASPDRAAALAA